MNRNEIESDPHALLEGMIIGAVILPRGDDPIGGRLTEGDSGDLGGRPSTVSGREADTMCRGDSRRVRGSAG